MASRPFASVAVVLEVGGDQEELLQVSRKTQTQIYTETNTTENDTHTVNTSEIVVLKTSIGFIYKHIPAVINATLGRFKIETFYGQA